MTRKLAHRTLTASCAFLLTFALSSEAGESHWIRLSSANFEMYTSASPRGARDTLREFEQVRSFFLQAFGGLAAKSTPVRLVAFGSTAEYQPYRLNDYAVAYYHPGTDRDYIVMSHSGADTFPMAVHEYVHLLARHDGLKLPPWLSEGLAELYSTLKPMGDKILVGDLIPGRHRALLDEKWIPLATILAADHASPYYNEKNKAGSLYNEGWALTHMLHFRQEYRPKFGQLVRSISDGEDSIQALQKVYGLPLERIEKDLQAYLRGSSFQGELVPAKLEKATGEIPVEPLGEFDVGLMFADLLYRPGKEVEHQAALERLNRQDPKRPEPYHGLAYLAWRAGRRDEAIAQFGKAYERGDRESKMLWDYGRLLEANHVEQSLTVLVELLSKDTTRMEVRLELAEAQYRANQPKAALQTLSGTRSITPADAPRYFRIGVYAHLSNDDQASALATAKHFQDVAKTGEDRAAAERLVNMATARRSKPTGPPERPAEIPSGDSPQMLHRESGAESTEMAPAPARPSVSGKFVELDCRGKQAHMIVETAEGRRTFSIEDPDRVVITAGSNGPVEMTCGPQKNPVKVEVGYDQPPANQPGLHGIVKTLAF